MLCKDIVDILDRQSPPEYALDWDNVGLLVGRRDKEVKKLLLVLDVTKEVCSYAVEQGFDMIVSHHPMIFKSVKRVNDSSVLGEKILSLAEAGICCYAMHTNFDTKGGMGREAAKRLSLKNTEVLDETLNGEGIGEVGMLDSAVSLIDYAAHVKNVFGLNNVMIYGDKQTKLEKIAISPGSGKSVIGEAIKKHADCLITGDIGHHDGIDAVEAGLTIIDASHYGIEKLFMDYMYNYLKDFMPDVYMEILDTGLPFEIV
ncbi:MAG: Nif3-like dinuclear metal center hexameric protein [Lachnospiraceae bacterium]|nr:Nif3-like dinuclear metal center hexameric protein [Lachnospiraceae bacterium]